jgi:hypothetical protein
MDLRDIDGDDGRWVELTPVRLSSWVFILSVLKFRLGWLISKMDLRQIACDDGKWIELAYESVK